MEHAHARHSTERAQLRGRRLVVATEGNQGRNLDESLVKSLTGGDPIRARFMRMDSFEFTPQLTLIHATNHRPVIRDDSQGMWRRMRLLPFDATFEGERENRNLDDELIAEAEGILDWAVEGSIRVADGEPSLPKRVVAANDEYRAEQDVLSQFLEDECEVSEYGSAPMKDMYRAFSEYCRGLCEGKVAFGKRLEKRGFKKGRASGGQREWKGISLRKDGHFGLL